MNRPEFPGSFSSQDQDTNLFSFFDSIRCINLYEREDRYNLAKAEFERLDISVEFYRTNKHLSDPVEGCFNSHIAVIKEAYDRGCDNVLVFEDDIYSNPIDLADRLGECIRFMKENNDWDLFYLGSVPEIVKYRTKKVTGYKDIYNLHAYGGHAYVVSRRYMKKMISMPYVGHAIDTIYTGTNNAYGILPSLFYQGNMGTDIQKVNSGAYKDSGIKFLETYSTTVNVPLAYLIFVIILALVLILIFALCNPKYRFFWLFLIAFIMIGVLLFVKHSDV
jgi:glycosyl transferase, family 25